MERKRERDRQRETERGGILPDPDTVILLVTRNKRKVLSSICDGE